MDSCIKAVRDYVNANLEYSLLVPDVEGLNPEAISVCDKISKDPVKRQALVDSITSHIVAHSAIYCKQSLNASAPNLCVKHYMDMVNVNFGIAQINRLAIYYNKTLEKPKRKQSTKTR